MLTFSLYSLTFGEKAAHTKDTKPKTYTVDFATRGSVITDQECGDFEKSRDRITGLPRGGGTPYISLTVGLPEGSMEGGGREDRKA